MVIKSHKDDEEQEELLRLYSNVLRPNSVLDVGTGFGWKYPCFKDSFYVGIDKNREHLKYNKAPNRILMDANHLAFRDGVFDLSFTCTVLTLPYNPKIDKIVKEMERVTKRYLLFLESRRKLSYGYKHDYKAKVKRFKFISERKLETPKSPLSLWFFAKEE